MICSEVFLWKAKHHSQIHQQQSSWLVQITIGGGGRIRVTDDFVVTIRTANIEVSAENVNAVNATQAKESCDKTQKGHFFSFEEADAVVSTSGWGQSILIISKKLVIVPCLKKMMCYHTCDCAVILLLCSLTDFALIWVWHSWLATLERTMIKVLIHTHMDKRFITQYCLEPKLSKRCCPSITKVGSGMYHMALYFQLG